VYETRKCVSLKYVQKTVHDRFPSAAQKSYRLRRPELTGRGTMHEPEPNPKTNKVLSQCSTFLFLSQDHDRIWETLRFVFVTVAWMCHVHVGGVC
jgi:hypothetical protein